MYYYDKPSPYAEQIEDIIINAVQDILPASFKTPRPSINKPALKKIIAGKAIDLYAESAHYHRSRH